VTGESAFKAVEGQEESGRVACTEAITQLSLSAIPFLVGGTYALRHYTKTERQTKDLDIFVRPGDVHRVFDLFERLGHRTELTFPHWLGKVFIGDFLMDVIYSSGNGVARVDDAWFAHAGEDEVCGVPVRISPPEEMIWSKSFVQERERFDGADVLHLIWHMSAALDWARLLERFGDHWRVLLSHLILFGFVYPDRRDHLPRTLMDELLQRLANDRAEIVNPVCNGTLLSRAQYLDDVQSSGYVDGRLEPIGRMTREELEIWTSAIHPPSN
jgi:hypothetical protein